MRHATVAILVLSMSFAARAEGVPAPAAAKVLVGDFVERGPIMRGLSHDQAMVQIINDTELPLDVALGTGTATMKGRETLLLRTNLGQIPLRVTCPSHPQHRLESTLSFDRILQYAVIITLVDAPLDLPGDAAVAESAPAAATPISSATAATDATAAAGSSGASPPRKAATPRKSGGKVDIGRKRPEERRQ